MSSLLLYMWLLARLGTHKKKEKLRNVTLEGVMVVMVVVEIVREELSNTQQGYYMGNIVTQATVTSRHYFLVQQLIDF